MSNTQSNISIKGQWCEPMLKMREYVINAYKYQGTIILFLILIPGWWYNVDRNSLIKGGPWWIPHWQHVTRNKVLEFWVWCNHRTDSKVTDTKICFDCRCKISTWLPFEHRAAWLKTWQHWLDEVEHNATMNNAIFKRLKGVAWLMKLDRLRNKLNTQFTEWNVDKFHVQRWLQTSILFAKWIDSLHLISPSWSMSASFHFTSSKRVH